MKICLAIPSKDHQAYIEQAVKSVLAAWPSGGQLELRILHTGADSAALCRVKRLIEPVEGASLICESDRGQADALYRCFAETDAELLGWLNSDDLLLPGALDHVFERFDRDNQIDVLYGNALFIDQHGACIGAYPVSEFDPDLLKSFCFISQPSTFFRRAVYSRVGGIDPGLQFALDYDLWLRLLKLGATFMHSRRVISATRLHGLTKTNLGGIPFTQEVNECQERIFPAETVAGRSAWKGYRARFHQGAARTPAFLAGIFAGGPVPQLPSRLRWGLKIALLHGQARLRARKYVGRIIEP